MPSLTSGLNFGYHKDKSTAKTWTTTNFQITTTMVGGLPSWNFTNNDADTDFMGSNCVPAAASVILFAASNSTPTTQFTLYWGSGAHHRHHNTYRSVSAAEVITVDWATPKITFGSKLSVTDRSGSLPWIPGSTGQLVDLITNSPDPQTAATVKKYTAWYSAALTATSADAASGSLFYDLFLVKAQDGNTYLRVNFERASIGFDSNEEQQFMRIGMLGGDHSTDQLFIPASSGNASSWNDALARTFEAGLGSAIEIPVDEGYAPTEQQQQTGSYTQTTSSGWSIQASAGASVGGGGDSSGSGGGGSSSSGGDAGGGGDAAAAAVA